MEQAMGQEPSDDRIAALRELFRGIGAVTEAGLEDGYTDTPAVELPEETLAKAGQIHDTLQAD